MHFSWCTVYINNMEESLHFYQEIAGLPLVRRFAAGPNQEIAFLGSDETKLELICHKDAGKVEIGKDISIGFITESLDDFMKLLEEKNIPITAGPMAPEPSIRFIQIKDPNGLTVQFSEYLNS